ncbi:MAG: asparagine synthase (glutamine-hydrolyzing) [Methylococcales bacterium]
MCGIAGVVASGPERNLDECARKMIDLLIHRGPDDSGIWSDAEHPIALGHRRLSILDLSPHGHQPMASNSGRYVIAFNGEIYNFARLRDEIHAADAGIGWRGHSDTEVLLAAFDRWGVELTLRKASGMFAIALWDRTSRTLTLARDRIGEKPLYYGVVGNRFLFASELKAVRAVAEGELRIDRDVVAEFMQFGYIPAPGSIYSGIAKLQPGHYVQVRSPFEVGSPRRFWSLGEPDFMDLRAHLLTCGDDELIAQVNERLSEAIGLQRVSDVPLGAFLSGGVDSSLVVALMQAQSPHKVRTYTIGFHEQVFNEAPYAKAVARHLGTEHTEMYVSSRDAAALIPELANIYDEPFADSSQIPTALVSRLTRRHVTVSLSGDGGDELFAGYPRYPITARLWVRMKKIPMPLRRAAACALRSLSAQGWDGLFAPLPSRTRAQINGRRVHRLAQLMLTNSLGEMYVRLMSQWQPEDDVVLGLSAQDFDPLSWPDADDAIEAMRRWDLEQYLPDDLLVKIDRASMVASLESRAPLLDHRIVELAFALPLRALVRNGAGKWILRRVLDRYVPSSLIERPKAGFSIPLGEWLKGPLRDWANDLLAPETLASQGFLDGNKVARMWSQHLAGSFDRSLLLWNVLIFQAWLDASRPAASVSRPRIPMIRAR